MAWSEVCEEISGARPGAIARIRKFKRTVAARVQAGEPVSAVARDVDVEEGWVRTWVAQAADPVKWDVVERERMERCRAGIVSGADLQAARERVGVSRQELAVILDETEKAVARLETMARVPLVFAMYAAEVFARRAAGEALN